MFATLPLPLQNGVISGPSCGTEVGVPHYVFVVCPFSKLSGQRMQAIFSPMPLGGSGLQKSLEPSLGVHRRLKENPTDSPYYLLWLKA